MSRGLMLGQRLPSLISKIAGEASENPEGVRAANKTLGGS